MKILHIIYDDIKNPWCGGGGALRALKVNEYLAHDNQFTVLTGNFPGAQNKNINGVSYIRIGFKFSYLLSRISFALFIPFYMKKFKSDIVINDCSFFAPCFADLYTKRPCVNIIHHLMGKHSFRLYSLLGLFSFTVEKIFLKTIKNVLTPSKSIKDEIQSKHVGKIVTNIANGVSNALFSLKPEEKKFILFLGRIDIYMKGLDILLESFSRIKNQNVFLKIAGSGKKGDVKKIIKLIRDFKLEDRVEFLGRVSEKDKFELLRTCLFLVMPSRFEGWGITAIESNAASKPVLGTNIKGLSEAVVNNKTALLIEPENIEKLTSSIDFLFENSDIRASLGKEGRIRAQKFSWKSISKQQLEFYESVLKN